MSVYRYSSEHAPVEEEEDLPLSLQEDTSVHRELIDLRPSTFNFDTEVTRTQQLVSELLARFGYPTNMIPDMQDTPRRFVKALMAHCFVEPWEFTTFAAPVSWGAGDIGDLGIVVQKDIPFVSHCAHHMAMFHGTAHVAYIPNGRMVGLSKLARTITTFSAGFCTQETIGQQSADFLMDKLQPLGVAVVLKAAHTCMTTRGARAHSAVTVTSCLRGKFFDDNRTRQEFFQLLQV